MENYQEWIELVAQGLLAITIVATIITKVTKSTKDDVIVGSAKDKFLKYLSYLPTFGINPRTKKLEEALKDLSEKK